jgi:hypothetical protein
MSYESIRLKRAEEFLAKHKLTEAFQAFVEVRTRELADLSQPAFYIHRTEHHGRRKRNNPMCVNITVWLRTASIESIKYLLEIDPETLPQEEIASFNNRDVRFLDEIWDQCLDEPWDEEDSYGNYEREYAYAFEIDLDELRPVLQEVNPAAYRALLMTAEEAGQMQLPQIVPADEDAPEEPKRLRATAW